MRTFVLTHWLVKSVMLLPLFIHCRCFCYCCCCMISNSIYNSFCEQQCEDNWRRLCNTIQNGTHSHIHTCLVPIYMDGWMDVMIKFSNNEKDNCKLQIHARIHRQCQSLAESAYRWTLSAFQHSLTHTQTHWIELLPARNLRRK